MHNSPPSSEANLRWQNQSHITRRTEECLIRGALRSAADLPPQQLTGDTERINSRRRPFLRPCPRLFASFGRLSLAPLRLPESGQTGPQKPPSPRRRCRFGPKTLLPSASPWRQPVYHSRPRNAPRSKARPDTLGQGPPGALATLLQAGDRSVEATQRPRIVKRLPHLRDGWLRLPAASLRSGEHPISSHLAPVAHAWSIVVNGSLLPCGQGAEAVSNLQRRK